MNSEQAMRLRCEKRAEILLEAYKDGDEEVSERYGITTRCLQKWRKALDEDHAFSEVFAEKKAFADSVWLSEYAETMRAGARFIRRSAEEGDATDPNMLHSVAGAMKLLSEIEATSRMVDARISGQAQSNGAAAKKAASGSGAVVQLKRAV